MILFLYGPPLSGKSAVGTALSHKLAFPLIDLDAQIEKQSGLSIPQIFEQEGESGFRKRESAALQDVCKITSDVVVALGGGTLLNAENRKTAEDHGQVLCLEVTIETLLARIHAGKNKRPLLDGNGELKLRQLIDTRAAHYASFSHQINVTSNISPDQIAEKIQSLVGFFHIQSMGGKGYDIKIIPNALEQLGWHLEQAGLKGPVALVSDSHVAPLYAGQAIQSLNNTGFQSHLITFPAGEAHKTIATVGALWQGFLEAGLDRHSTVVSLGGGVVNDLSGFAAATYLRGIQWATVPTTLLAMIDASIGGKTGADLPEGKNLVGAFHAPRLVLIDPQTLRTLPERELRCGIAEVVKHGVISDPELFKMCAKGWPFIHDNLLAVIRKAVAVKARVIEIDPFEKGIRQALNFGHTIGHGIELASNYQLSHGEAVAIGMVIATRIAEDLKIAQPGLTQTITNVLQALGLSTSIPAEIDPHQIQQAMKYDKKRAAGSVRFALPVKVGEVQVGIPVSDVESYLVNKD